MYKCMFEEESGQCDIACMGDVKLYFEECVKLCSDGVKNHDGTCTNYCLSSDPWLIGDTCNQCPIDTPYFMLY